MKKFNNIELRNIRENKRISALDIANKLNMDLNSYRDIEEGYAIPTKSVVNKIAKILDIDIELIYDKNARETKIINIFNEKGGVGKTTITYTLAITLAKMGKKVLCLDLDGQCNLTSVLNMDVDKQKNIYQLFIDEENPNTANPLNYIQETPYENVHIICGSPKVTRLTAILAAENGKEFIMNEMFKNIVDDVLYDYILLDNAPSESLILTNALYLAQYSLVPVVVGQALAVEGIAKTFNFANSCLRNNSRFRDLRILVNIYDRRVALSDNYFEAVKNAYANNICETVIRVDASLERAIKLKQSIYEYNTNCKAVSDFKKLADEIMEWCE